MKRLAVLAFMAIVSVSGCAPSDDGSASSSALREAAAAYQDGAYDKAIASYEDLIAGGLGGGALYYDLGNAYLKKSRIGKAILNYTRASHYIPRDSELLANLSRARALMKQPDPKPDTGAFVQELSRLFSVLTIGEALGISFVTYYLLTALIVITILVKKQRILLITLAILFTVSLALMAPPVFYKLYDLESGAIATGPIIDVKKEPYDDASVSFPLYEGMKVYILKEGVGWVKVRRPDGRVGWVSTSGVERIWPQ